MKRRYLGSDEAMVGPHDFRPLSRFLHQRTCRACYLPLGSHPVRGYVTARPLGDKSGGREPTP